MNLCVGVLFGTCDFRRRMHTVAGCGLPRPWVRQAEFEEQEAERHRELRMAALPASSGSTLRVTKATAAGKASGGQRGGGCAECATM